MPAARALSTDRLLAALALGALIALLPGRAHAWPWDGETIKGSGVSKTETRVATGFHAVSLGIDARVELRQGDTEGVTLTGDDNIVPLVETVVEKGTLKIRWPAEGHYSLTYKKLDIVVNLKDIDGIRLGGSGDIHAAKLRTGTLHTQLAGSGDILLDALDADALRGSIAGSGTLKAAGRADTVEFSLAGSGDLIAPKLESRRVTISVQGSADAIVWATESLTATVAGSGDVKYYGKPQVTQTVAGSGSVRRARDAT
jgi:hypothetical protein